MEGTLKKWACRLPAPYLTVSGQEGGTGVGTEAEEEAIDMTLKQGQTPAWGGCLHA